MNFVNDRRLAARFAAGTVPGKERAIYLAASVALNYVFFAYCAATPGLLPSIDKYYIAGEVSVFTAVMVTLALAYRVNEMGDDRDFVERYVCLSLPISLQFTVLDYVLRAVEYQILMTHTELAMPAWHAIDIGMTALLYGYALWRTATAFRIASGADHVLARA